MTILNIEPKYDLRQLMENPTQFAYVPHGIELYTSEQVFQILNKAMAHIEEERDREDFLIFLEAVRRKFMNGGDDESTSTQEE